MDNLDKYLTMLEAEAGIGGFEQLNSFESYEAENIENYLVSSRGLTRPQAVNAAQKIVRTPALFAMVKNEMAANSGQGIIKTGGDLFTPKSAALFNINIRRVTDTIKADLPYFLFGATALQSAYREVMPVLPAGVFLQQVRTGLVYVGRENIVELVYTNGVDTDTVEISCEETAYSSFINSTTTDVFKISKVRMSISDVLQQQQFNKNIRFFVKSMFGKDGSDRVVPKQYKSPMQQQQDIIDLEGEFSVDKETTFISKIIPVANFSISFSMFVEKFYRQNAKGF